MKVRIIRPLVALAVLAFLSALERPFAIADPPGFFPPSHSGNTITATNSAGRAVGFAYLNDFSGVSGTSKDAWYYDGTTTVQIGFLGVDGGYTIPYLYPIRFSQPQRLNDAGHAVGFSRTFVVYPSPAGGVVETGQSAWFYDGDSIQQIGLLNSFTQVRFDLEDIHYSEAQQLNNAGQVIGYSKTYHVELAPVGPFETGQQAWFFDGSTRRIGLGNQFEFSADDGYGARYEFDEAQFLLESGLVIGYAKIHEAVGSPPVVIQTGTASWLFDGSTTIELPFDTSAGISFVFERTNLAGDVVFTPEGPSGRHSFLFHAGGVSGVGLYDADHTRADGYQYNNPWHLNESGQVTGFSRRFSGVDYSGQSAWFYDGASNVRIGLTDTEHTRADGFQFSDPKSLNETGQVIGSSRRYSGVDEVGQSAWFYDGASNVRIGLTDTEHTRANGFQSSNSTDLNEAGQVIGVSSRYSGANSAGLSAWIYDAESTVKIGPTDAEFTSADGEQWNVVWGLNEAGQVIGDADRYSGLDFIGRSAWFYDATSGETVPLMLSQRSDGYSLSFPLYLFEDGLVLGYFILFDGTEYLGYRPFYFRPGDIARDFGSLLGSDFDVPGFDSPQFERIGGTIQVEAYNASNGTFLSVTVYEPLPGPGDYNGDGTVNAADYTIWRDELGRTTYPGSGADGNGDGMITQADYDVWKLHFGQTAGSGSSGNAPVPEPNTLVLLLVGYAVIGRMPTLGFHPAPWALGVASRLLSAADIELEWVDARAKELVQ